MNGDSAPTEGIPPTIAARLFGVFAECRAALEGLERSTGNPVEHIHTLRKRGKRLRGGLKILGAPKRVLRELRDMGRILSTSRDAAVRAATLRGLRQEPGESFRGDSDLDVAEALLAEEASLGGGTPAAAVLAFLADRLAAVEAWLRDWQPADPPLPPADVVGRLARQARKHLQRLAGNKEARPDRCHAARKAVKRLHGALWFVWPESDEATAKNLRQLVALGDDLGEVNDLDVLALWLERSGLTEERLAGLHRAMARRRRRLTVRVARRARGLAAFLATPVPDRIAPPP